MKTVSQIQIELNADLKKFGLNPRDWTLIKEKPQTYKISNNSDHSFTFKGYTKTSKQKLTWDFIHLNSL